MQRVSSHRGLAAAGQGSHREGRAVHGVCYPPEGTHNHKRIPRAPRSQQQQQSKHMSSLPTQRMRCAPPPPKYLGIRAMP